MTVRNLFNNLRRFFFSYFDCNFDIFWGKIQKFVKNLDAIEESMVPNKSLTEVFLG